MAKYILQIVVIGTQVVGKAFAKSIRQEYEASEALARARYGYGQIEAERKSKRKKMTFEEAIKILNVKRDSTPEEINKNYEFLFDITDEKRSSLYLQSKVFRAKELLDNDLKTTRMNQKQGPRQTDSTTSTSATKPPHRS